MKRVAVVADPQPLEDQLRAQVKSLWNVILVITVALLAVAAGAAYGFVQADDATSQATAISRAEAKLSQQIAQSALESTSAIKADRNSYVLRECRDQNRRHRNTIRYIHAVGVREAHRKHIGVRVAERQLRPFVLLMDAAIPHRDCQQSLARATGR